VSRLGVLGLSLLVALVIATGAGATSVPPRGGAQSLPRIPFIALAAPARGRAACHAHGRQGPAVVRKYAKKLAPVSCEQPPRANIRNTGSNLIITP
jgi:hypothetical protein